LDEDQVSAGARSDPASLLHPWMSGSLRSLQHTPEREEQEAGVPKPSSPPLPGGKQQPCASGANRV
jgi:hypothetical protein